MNTSQKVFYRMNIKILWDFSVQTDHVIETCKIINFAVPGDSKIKEQEKDRKVSRSKRRVIEYLKCENEDYTISCGLLRCYT